MITTTYKTVAFATLIAAAASVHANFASLVIARIQDPYGKLTGVKSHDSFINTIQVGQLRRYSRLGHWPLPRKESDYRTDELEIDPVSWMELLPAGQRNTLSNFLITQTNFGSGAVTFRKERSDRGQFEGVLKMMTSALGISVNAGDHSTLSINVIWQNIGIKEFKPTGLKQLSDFLAQNSIDPYHQFSAIKRHESWMVTQAVCVEGLKIEIITTRPDSGFSVTVEGVAGLESKRESESRYVVDLTRSVSLASKAKNIQRADIYKFAGLKMPKL